MLKRFKEILEIEAEAIRSVPLDESLKSVVAEIINCKGKVFTTGIGKAGYVARKGASTLSTTGTPAVFLHPGDASHGDIGAITSNDLLIAYSNSGKTREVIETIHFCKRLGLEKLIVVTSNSDSPIAKESTHIIDTGKVEEPCPFGLTPTASTTVMIALTDALALVVMEERNFTRKDYALRHHGGYIGEITKDER